MTPDDTILRMKLNNLFNEVDELVARLAQLRDASSGDNKARYRYSARELEKSLDRIEKALERLEK